MKCFRCGECCKAQYKSLTVTQEELDIVQFAPVVEVGKNRFKAVGEECPFLIEKQCAVYDIRPCQCRMYHCGRINKGDKKLETIGDVRELMLRNPDYMKFKMEMDNKAVAWGNAHGWNWRKLSGN